MSKQPMCPKCCSPAYRVDIDTKPVLFACDTCTELFTRRGRVPVAKVREVRRSILQRWDQLADDLWHLEQDIKNAPAGTFTRAERDDAEFELGETVWNVMVNHRPRLPASAFAKRRERVEAARRAIIRQDYLDVLTEAERVKWLDGISPEKLKQWLAGEDFGRESPVRGLKRTKSSE